MDNQQIIAQNRVAWDAIADDWFGRTALPTWGISAPTEYSLHLLGDLHGKRILDLGCGSGHSLSWCAAQGAADLWGLDLSAHQLKNAAGLLSGLPYTLKNQPMEDSSGIPVNYFDAVYSVYAIGWTTDLYTTFHHVSTYLKPGGIFVFSWDHPLMHCTSSEGNCVKFDGSYLDEGPFSSEKGGWPFTMQNRKLSTYINTLSAAGLFVETVVEETEYSDLDTPEILSRVYYTPVKARHFPLSVIIKARKPK